jgi:hypothetical protein
LQKVAAEMELERAEAARARAIKEANERDAALVLISDIESRYPSRCFEILFYYLFLLYIYVPQLFILPQ